jgi:hypothetical protein
MKNLLKLSLVLIFMFNVNRIYSQIQIDSLKTYVIKKHDGTEFIGRVIQQDLNQVVMETKKLGKLSIPKHEIVEIKEVQASELNEQGELLPTEIFNTRYFITTNALPIKKGDSYLLWNLFGPDFQFGVGKNFGMGIMTTWIGTPIIANAKYSIALGKNTRLGVGTLLGSGSYVAPQFYMALPFAALTFGNKSVNINFSGGYGYVSNKGEGAGRGLCSVAAMFKVTKKVSFVFDTFILLNGQSTFENQTLSRVNSTTGKYETYVESVERKKPGFALVIPGIRFQTDKNKAFQLGFAGINSQSSWSKMPIPMLQWFRSL